MTDDMEVKTGYALLNIHCSNCGAPAEYDIRKHSYVCKYCGTETGIRTAVNEKKGFRTLKQQELGGKKKELSAVGCVCTGCGAKVVFPENEVSQTCPFCGRALVRGEYLDTAEFPELILPFRITEQEAKELLKGGCEKHRHKKEAGRALRHLEELKGYYLPYELIHGPVDCTVYRYGSGRSYECGGYLDSVFVNTSSQLDNLTLDAAEPYDLSELREFDFGYIARQNVKVEDIGAKSLDYRVREEISSSYGPVVARTMETRSIQVDPHTGDLLRMPVLLPVYFISCDGLSVAVNGQTGKVAVRSERKRFALPWWLKPIFATLLTFAAAVAVAAWLFSRQPENAGVPFRKLLFGGGTLLFAGMFTLVMGLIYYTGYSDAYEGSGRFELFPQVYTTNRLYERGRGGALAESRVRLPEPAAPVFFENLDGKVERVEIRFTTVKRVIKMLLLGLLVIFLPTLIAFVLNGFSTEGLVWGGAAVWFCVFVPVVPAYLMKMGRIDIYENPYVYRFTEKGRKRRVRLSSRTTTVWDVLKILFTPPAIWAGLAILLFLVMGVYLTLGG